VRTLLVAVVITWSAVTASVAQNWNPRLAAEYLDGRQQKWSEWPRAQSANGACVSCHTGMTYLIARPALRRTLGESGPTKHEVALLDRLRSNVGAKPPAALRDVEVTFAALFLAMNEPGARTLSADAEKAFEQLWALQLKDGASAGAWKWYSVNLDPWEMPESTFFGAALAALAVGSAPAEYRARPEVQASVQRLSQYLEANVASQPLHNRVALLWAASKLPDVIPSSLRQRILDDVFAAQRDDGAWVISALGPFNAHEGAPALTPATDAGYATGFTTFVLQQAGTPKRDPRLQRALGWLRSHQDEGGTWGATSLNKTYPDGSMEQLFMRDAATAFAAAALAGAL
jgi:squalene-hopene/tetraprenyl-beta-curcumene cyclase